MTILADMAMKTLNSALSERRVLEAQLGHWPDLMSAIETSRALGVSKSTLLRLLETGVLRAVCVGDGERRLKKIAKGDVIDYLLLRRLLPTADFAAQPA